LTRVANPSLAALRDFSLNLQKAVSGTGLSPYTLARNIGLDRAAIKNAMSGDCDPRLSTMIRIAKGMKLSLDSLVGGTPADKPIVKPASVPETEVKKENIGFIDKIAKMHEQDVELLEKIACLLNERRISTMTKLFQAVQGSKLREENKKVSGESDDGFESDDFEHDEDFDDDDDYEDDDDSDDNEDEGDDFDYGDDFDDDDDDDDETLA
jgi:transcriptional regulator with XRE-family HTH domain